MESAGFTTLRRHPGYTRFYATATLTRLADEMFSVGAVLLVLERTGSAALAGATIAAVTLPSLITGPVLGAWLDRSGRRRNVMILDQLLAATTIVAIVALAGHAPNWTVPLVALCAGITWPLSFGGFTSLIPVIVPEELLPPANALEATSFNLATISGPALAGTISALAGPATSLLIEAGLTLSMIGMIGLIPSLNRAGSGQRRPLRAIVRSGLAHVIRTPPLRAVTAAGAFNLGGLGLLTVAFPFFAVDALGAHRSTAGYLWAAFAAGSAVGALGLVRLQSIWRPERVVFGALASLGVLMLLWPLASALPVALLLIALAGVADGPNLSATFATRQRWTPRNLHGQIFTTAASLKVGSFSLGAALAGPAVVGLGARGTLVVAACMQLAAAGVGLLLTGAVHPREGMRRRLGGLDLDQDEGVQGEDNRERDRPSVQVALDERPATERPTARTADAERSRKARVAAGVQQHQEDQADREKDLEYLEHRLHRGDSS
jgi:predicted MFS family arabinose efflux permease